MNANHFKIGKYAGFLASMTIFTTVLYFATSHFRFHSLGYAQFYALFAAFYFLVRMTIKVLKNDTKTIV